MRISQGYITSISTTGITTITGIGPCAKGKALQLS